MLDVEGSPTASISLGIESGMYNPSVTQNDGVELEDRMGIYFKDLNWISSPGTGNLYGHDRYVPRVDCVSSRFVWVWPYVLLG